MLEGTSGNHPVQPPCSKQDQPEQAAQDCAWSGFEHLPGWRLHNLSRQPVPVFLHPHGKKKRVVIYAYTEFPAFHLEPIVPCPVTGHHCEVFGPILFIPSYQVVTEVDEIHPEPSLPRAEQPQLCQSHPLYVRYS